MPVVILMKAMVLLSRFPGFARDYGMLAEMSALLRLWIES